MKSQRSNAVPGLRGKDNSRVHKSHNLNPNANTRDGQEVRIFIPSNTVLSDEFKATFVTL